MNIHTVMCRAMERPLILGSSASSGESDKAPFSVILSMSVKTSSF